MIAVAGEGIFPNVGGGLWLSERRRESDCKTDRVAATGTGVRVCDLAEGEIDECECVAGDKEGSGAG